MRRNKPTLPSARETLLSPRSQASLPTRAHTVLVSRAGASPPTRQRRGGGPAVSVEHMLVRFALQNRRLRTLIRQSKRAPVSSPRAMIHEQADSCHPVITRLFPSGGPKAGGKYTTSQFWSSLLQWWPKTWFPLVPFYVRGGLKWPESLTPWRYIHFITYAWRCIMLRRAGAGGGYAFIHPLLQDYFAGRS